MRVHELAKEYNIKSTDFVDIIQEFGIDIKSHLSTLDDAQVADIRQKLEDKKKEEEAAADQNVVSNDAWALGSEDSSVEPETTVSIAEVEKEIASNIKAAGAAREQYAETVKAIASDPEQWSTPTAKTEPLEEQTVIVETPRGFWGWLKSLFS